MESVQTIANKRGLLSCLFSPANGGTNKGYLVEEPPIVPDIISSPLFLKR